MSTKTTDREIDVARRDAALALLPPIFGRCLDPEATRYSLWAPALIGDMAYATDGRICVRMPASPEVVAAVGAIAPRGRFPDVAVVFDLPAMDPTPYPVPGLDDAPKCGACKGAGRVEQPDRVECDECHGDGETECYACGHEEECTACRGEGTLPGKGKVVSPCGECDGCGLYDPVAYGKGMAVQGKSMLAFKYLAILRDAGASLQFAAKAPRQSPVRFATPDGVDGVLMPLTWNGE